MRLYLVWAFIAVVFGVAGFLGLVGGIVGFVLWGVAVVFLVLAMIAFRRRSVRADPQSPRR